MALSTQIVHAEVTILVELTRIHFPIPGSYAQIEFRAYVMTSRRKRGFLKRVAAQRGLLEQLQGKLTDHCVQMALDYQPPLSSLRVVKNFRFGRGGKITMILVPLL